jgi:hypothetical protein
LRGYGYGRALGRLPAAVPSARANSVVDRRGVVTEQYSNGPLGIEQEFVPARPLSLRAGGHSRAQLPSQAHCRHTSVATTTATVEDTGTGASPIASAEARIDLGEWMPMTPSDGAFDQPSENVRATLAPAASARAPGLRPRHRRGR